MPADTPPATQTVGWRTRLLPGAEEDYERTHRRIPERLAAALRLAGVVEWRIWRDGLTLFHVIETTHGTEEMGRRMAELGPVDAEWDALIATMVDAAADASATVPLVWGMDTDGQFS